MADEKYNIEVLVKAQLEELGKVQSALDEINQKVNKFSKETSAANKVWSGAMMNIGAQITNFAVNKLKQIPAAIMGSIQAFGQQEMAVQKLAAAIRSQGGSVSEVLPIMSAFASEMQRITTYGDEQVLAMQAMATSMGVSSAQMQGVIKSAIGLASALNMDVMTAIKVASAAVQGKTTMLQEYIPSLAKCKTEEEKLAKVQELSASGFAQAKAEAETTAGKLKQAANAWGDLAEVAGGTFAPVAVEVANALKFVCEWISKNQEFTQLLIGSLSSLAVGFAFSRIGGLANVAALFKTVSTAITGTKAASDALNVSLKANPLGIAATAVSAFAMAVSYMRGKERERYNQNIEQSKEYRNSIDAEIDALKRWGISAEDNKKRTDALRAEISKLENERAEYENANRKTVNTGSMGGASSYIDPAAKAQIDNYNAKIGKLNEALKAYSDVKGLAKIREKEHAAAVKASEEILARSAEEMRAASSATEALKVTRQRYAETEKEIIKLEGEYNAGAWTDEDREANANRLRQARLELLELGKKELEQETALASSNYAAQKTAELKKQNELEMKLAEAKLKNNTLDVNSLTQELENVKLQQKKLEIITSYISARKDEVKTESDLKSLQAEAKSYAESMLESIRAQKAAEEDKAETKKWIDSESESSARKQHALEISILEAKAAGNTELVKSREAQLKILQISSEIFNNADKEGKSRNELIELQNSSIQQARERYALESAVADEVERQNLAKNAQAKVEDILLANKIEQLKAEGKMAEAKALEQERDIKRTLAGLEGVSEDDKKMLENTMRQTNAYKDKQQAKSAPGASAYNFSGSAPAGGGGGGIGGGGGAKSPRIATVSAKNADLYAAWKAQGGAKSGKSWIDFRNENGGYGGDPDKKKGAQARQLQATGMLNTIEQTASGVAGRVSVSAAKSASRSAPKETKSNAAASSAAAPALKNKLENADVNMPSRSGDSEQAIGEMSAVIKTISEDLKSVKTSITALAEKREN